jgi:hypothetical protein
VKNDVNSVDPLKATTDNMVTYMAIPSEALKCKRCGGENPPQKMVKGKPWLCKACNAVKTKDWRSRTGMSEYRRVLSKNLTDEEKQKYRERHYRYQKKSDAKRFARMSVEELASYKAKRTADQAARYAALKAETYAAYGGAICKCCGETEPLFLSIDHVFNDGNLQRKQFPKLKGGYSLYFWLKSHSFPGGFQVLCMNCQTGKHRNKGVCPHQRTCDGQGASPYPQAGGSASELTEKSVYEMTCSLPKGKAARNGA